jgi:hypothetical protein
MDVYQVKVKFMFLKICIILMSLLWFIFYLAQVW